MKQKQVCHSSPSIYLHNYKNKTKGTSTQVLFMSLWTYCQASDLNSLTKCTLKGHQYPFTQTKQFTQCVSNDAVIVVFVIKITLYGNIKKQNQVG